MAGLASARPASVSVRSVSPCDRLRAFRCLRELRHADPGTMEARGSERGPVALPVFKIGRCPRFRGRAGFDSQALPPAFALDRRRRLRAEAPQARRRAVSDESYGW